MLQATQHLPLMYNYPSLYIMPELHDPLLYQS